MEVSLFNFSKIPRYKRIGEHEFRLYETGYTTKLEANRRMASLRRNGKAVAIVHAKFKWTNRDNKRISKTIYLIYDR